jgi:hypothetical protein
MLIRQQKWYVYITNQEEMGYLSWYIVVLQTELSGFSSWHDLLSSIQIKSLACLAYLICTESDFAKGHSDQGM